ncbi:acetyl/propionyl/methylcrotonyl-CoA carboxylase subunit alpha [Sinimarinibacterium sp. CAU 1509]|uniref:acetyl-CoA carboxylase biotin carboxylase subunit n=1 Tax=Sinimarinibacterium sp. CAU 1509 TaxID=2562283 RepID=UPI0010ACAC39|nr:acetyl/propionyl/methylcrotonyl-CoA carboxylase subunit alpha [Sinimarinibacterium sp. CAU 1509]
MFDKILIANRGEIACRVIKTCRRLGIRTVAVFSEADRHARHVRLADEAICVGPAAARESYLVAERIIEVARATGAQAIHPGYGFLSENEAFAEACAAADIVFIGPPVAAIHAMGSKSAAKALMAQAGVPLVPGYHGDDQTPALLQQQADAIGYPVLIKASAGGGGKGMRVVERSEDFAAALASCQREAASSFGDDRVLIEKYLLEPRHVEIQVFGDTQGTVVHLFERDCSLQRRHQKVVEEAPAPGMSAERRAAMGKAAVDAARAVGYVGAGTVEFIVDRSGAFFFMEMNTRLQVEHPVTEMITGQDLVEWQLRVAAGQPLPLTQDELAIHGHAIEVRVYAEDADAGFLPSIGRLQHLGMPRESAHVRIDTGVEQGDEITPYYDPMIAKLIVWDESRPRALQRMAQALMQCRIVGVTANIGFLERLVTHPAFVEGQFDTGLIGRQLAQLCPPTQAAAETAWQLAALAQLLDEQARSDVASPWHADGWRMNGAQTRTLTLLNGGEERSIQVDYAAQGYVLTLDGRRCAVRGERRDDGQLLAELDGQPQFATVVRDGERLHVFTDAIHGAVFTVIDPLAHAGEDSDAHGGLVSPMPGKIVALLAEVGVPVDKGAPLLVLEAMKMEHTITAPSAGVVRSFRYPVGEQVAGGAELLEFEASA